MQISRIEMTKPCVDGQQRLCRADVKIFLGPQTEGSGQIAHLQCKAIATGIENHQQLLDGLLVDALRQMRWMPEFRSGEITLDDLPTITGVNTL